MFGRFRIVSGAMFLCAGLSVHAAVVTPDPNSLLSTKKILILDGTNTASHPQTKAAAESRLHWILDTLLKVPVANRTFAGTSLSLVTTAGLASYDIVVFNYFFETQLMTTAQQNAIKAWLALGNKGYVGYHTSGANELNEWNWYRDSVTSMDYRLHSGSAQNGSIYVTTDTSIANSNNPIMKGLPSTWSGIDEWYTFTPGLTWGDTSGLNHNANVRVMYYLNESSLPTPLPDAMGIHPAAWYRQDSRNTRYFYSIFTHDPVAATTDFFVSVLLRAMEYVAGSRAVPIVNGSPVYNKGVIYLSSERALQVESNENYRLNIWSIRGEHLYSAMGRGGNVYRPEAFKKPGVYFAKLESKEGVFTQKVMVQ